jgi:hypothetical protein
VFFTWKCIKILFFSRFFLLLTSVYQSNRKSLKKNINLIFFLKQTRFKNTFKYNRKRATRQQASIFDRKEKFKIKLNNYTLFCFKKKKSWLNDFKGWCGQHLPLEFQKVYWMWKYHFQSTNFWPRTQPTPLFLLSFHFLNDNDKKPSSK